jgi:hypothetical protein
VQLPDVMYQFCQQHQTFLGYRLWVQTFYLF